MNPMAQPDLHPDADLLNAFAEHALPEAERARVMAHMAGCGRCREVLFLAQAAVEPETAPPVFKPEPRPGWFSAAFTKWRVALIPATALAAVGGIVLWVQLHPVAPGTQMAKLAPPTAPPSSQASPPQSAARPAEPTARHREEAAVANNALSSAASSLQVERTPALQSKKAATGVAAVDQLARTDVPNAPASSEPAEQGRAAGGIHLDGRSAATARYSMPPQALGSASVATFSAAPPAPDGQQPPMTTSQQATVTVDSAAVPIAPAPAPSPPNIVAVHGAPFSAGHAQIAAPPSSKVELAPQPMNGPAVMRLALRAKLPSGLNTVSSAALLNRLVAVDSAGGVFQSQDGGKNWDAVFPRWTGKVVQVQAPTHSLYALIPAKETKAPELSSVSSQALVASAPGDNATPPPFAAANDAPSPATPNAKAKAKAAPPVLPLQFRLVTDRHEVWVSADGKVWRRQ